MSKELELRKIIILAEIISEWNYYKVVTNNTLNFFRNYKNYPEIYNFLTPILLDNLEFIVKSVIGLSFEFPQMEKIHEHQAEIFQNIKNLHVFIEPSKDFDELLGLIEHFETGKISRTMCIQSFARDYQKACNAIAARANVIKTLIQNNNNTCNIYNLVIGPLLSYIRYDGSQTFLLMNEPAVTASNIALTGLKQIYGALLRSPNQSALDIKIALSKVTHIAKFIKEQSKNNQDQVNANSESQSILLECDEAFINGIQEFCKANIVSDEDVKNNFLIKIRPYFIPLISTIKLSLNKSDNAIYKSILNHLNSLYYCYNEVLEQSKDNQTSLIVEEFETIITVIDLVNARFQQNDEQENYKNWIEQKIKKLEKINAEFYINQNPDHANAYGDLIINKINSKKSLAYYLTQGENISNSEEFQRFAKIIVINLYGLIEANVNRNHVSVSFFKQILYRFNSLCLQGIKYGIELNGIDQMINILALYISNPEKNRQFLDKVMKNEQQKYKIIWCDCLQMLNVLGDGSKITPELAAYIQPHIDQLENLLLKPELLQPYYSAALLKMACDNISNIQKSFQSAGLTNLQSTLNRLYKVETIREKDALATLQDIHSRLKQVLNNKSNRVIGLSNSVGLLYALLADESFSALVFTGKMSGLIETITSITNQFNFSPKNPKLLTHTIDILTMINNVKLEDFLGDPKRFFNEFESLVGSTDMSLLNNDSLMIIGPKQEEKKQHNNQQKPRKVKTTEESREKYLKLQEEFLREEKKAAEIEEQTKKMTE